MHGTTDAAGACTGGDFTRARGLESGALPPGSRPARLSAACAASSSGGVLERRPGRAAGAPGRSAPAAGGRGFWCGNGLSPSAEAAPGCGAAARDRYAAGRGEPLQGVSGEAAAGPPAAAPSGPGGVPRTASLPPAAAARTGGP